MKQYFTCNKCRYTFYMEEGCNQCPDCGKKDIRPATDKEISEYLQHREEFKDNKSNK